MIKDTKKKFKILPALLLCFSLLAIAPKTSAKASESANEELSFSVYNITEHHFVEINKGMPTTYTVEASEIEGLEKIEVGDTLKNCTIVVYTDGFYMTSKNGNYIESSDFFKYGKDTDDNGSVYPTYQKNQVVYIDGEFGEVSSINGNAYYYDETVYKPEKMHVGEKLLNTPILIYEDNSNGAAFKCNNVDFLLYVTASGSKKLCAAAFSSPTAIDDKISVTYNPGNNAFFTITESFEFEGVTFDENSFISEVSESTYKIVEVKPVKDKAPEGPSGSVGGGAGGGTIGNIESTEDQPINFNWLWYVGAGLLLCGGALFVISRR